MAIERELNELLKLLIFCFYRYFFNISWTIYIRNKTCVLLCLKTEKSVQKQVAENCHHIQEVEENLIDNHNIVNRFRVLRKRIQASSVQEKSGSFCSCLHSFSFIQHMAFCSRCEFTPTANWNKQLKKSVCYKAL